MELHSHASPAPTIVVRRRRGPALLALLVGLTLLVVTAIKYAQFSFWFAALSLTGAGGLTTFAALLVCDRQPRVIIGPLGVELPASKTGLLRWHEIIHVESFRLPGPGPAAVALFLTEEAAARLPYQAIDRTPVFAHAAFAGPPLWFSDGSLDASAIDMAAEINARRRGDVGPLTPR